MANLNACFLIGRLTADPESRTLGTGAVVCDLRMAVNRVWSTKEGERREETLYIDATTWNRLAENCAKYLRKGRQVCVSGHLVQDTWEDKQSGEKRSKIKVIADDVQFLDGGQGQGERGGVSGADFRPAATRDGGGVRRPATRPPAGPMPPIDETDEDIPFARQAEECPFGGLS